MYKITILCVGGLKEAYWRDACAEYHKRLRPFCRFTVTEVAEERIPNNPSAAQIKAVIDAEGERLLAKLEPSSLPVALCIEGKERSSEQLAALIEQYAVGGEGDITFLIGGSWGLSEAVKAKARLRMSMSPMTFPHQLARVMLCEQVYRAMQILSGGQYHK
ncbi:MAG: 23S rRNA (pseudouridine(1915)-N(3))-methyltransferase RlmH [Ruminococcaceae bacterium]|nr:23S rRNA (pseudouridine(1915)-N(3))-methyltransferase RlmH [Oscillospiraceae bacterium]